MVKFFLSILIVLCGTTLWAQDSSVQTVPDTTVAALPVPKPAAPKRRIPKKVDSSLLAKDSFLKPTKDTTMVAVSPVAFSDSFRYARHPLFHFTNPIRYAVSIRKWQGKETVFYSMVALLLFFALIRNGFRKYISDLFKIFFRTSVNQRQIKEQLLQSPLPSMLLNIFFLLSIGMFLALLLQYYQMGGGFRFWVLFIYCILALIGIYTMKFITLKLLGWIFQMKEATDNYIFIVFTTNKVIGMALLPFLIVLAFSHGLISVAVMNLSILVVLALFAYRFFLSYITIHRQVRISFFHFLIYLFAFEVIPLLLINKLLFRFLGETS